MRVGRSTRNHRRRDRILCPLFVEAAQPPMFRIRRSSPVLAFHQDKGCNRGLGLAFSNLIVEIAIVCLQEGLTGLVEFYLKVIPLSYRHRPTRERRDG